MSGGFWNFSLKVYAAPGVGEECLHLQDASGIDVNVLLFCAYLGAGGATLSSRDLSEITTLVGDWHRDVVKPLRSARRAAKTFLASATREANPDVANLRITVKNVELESERIEQEWLDRWARNRRPQAGADDAATAVRANIRLLLRSCDAASAPDPERLIQIALAQR